MFSIASLRMSRQPGYRAGIVAALGLLLWLLSAAPPSLAGANATELVVGLYPYVPNPQQFRDAITAKWRQKQPSVALVFLDSKDWDGGYDKDPPPNADVFVFDAMFLDYFRSKGWLSALTPSEIQDRGDFVKYALDGVVNGSSYSAIPQLGCANVLFYNKSDAAIANAKKLSEVTGALSRCTYTSRIPPDRRGLMIDMAGATTNASLYLDTEHSQDNLYPLPLPPKDKLNPDAIGRLRALLGAASWENSTVDTAGFYDRGAWLSKGWGRAFVGYTESMSAMDPDKLAAIGFKLMPLSDNLGAHPLFYADVIGINATTAQRGTRDLAVQLANVMAAADTMVQSLEDPTGGRRPQYLMSTRPSVFRYLGAMYPVYNDMYKLIPPDGTPNSALMFRLPAQSRDWLKQVSDTIRGDARAQYPCGCDYPANQSIPNTAAAPPICNATCASHGGWLGQWTNDPPAAQGKSVCGCRVCPLSKRPNL